MYKYVSELPPLEEVEDELAVEESSVIKNTDIEDFKESIQYFITDYINNNIKSFKYKTFEDDLFEAIYSLVTNTYGSLLYNIDDLDYHIWNALKYIFIEQIVLDHIVQILY